MVLLQPDVDLWKLRELALSEGGLVNDTIRRRAWPKLVGLSSYDNNPDDIKSNSSGSSPRSKTTHIKEKRKGTAPNRVTNFGQDENQQGTVLTGGIFDQHDTAATSAMPEDDNDSQGSFDSLEPSEVVACLDAEQIDRDVTRCTWHLLTGGQRTRRRVMVNKHRKKISRILRRKQRRLGDLINLTLAVSEQEFPLSDRLCYFQGHHDVASIFLAALGGASTKGMDQQKNNNESSTKKDDPPTSEPPTAADTPADQAARVGLELSAKVLYQVSRSHFREPMRSNFMHLQTALRMVMLPLLNAMDPEVHAHLYGCSMEPFFALSWVLTWFSHDIRDTVLVKRLFDFFLVSHPLMPIYLSVAMMCHPSNRKEILATPCEFAELHSVLQGLPKNSSMVGWKWSVGVDGYVSDDEQVGEDGETSISLDSDMVSHQSGGNSNRVPSLLSGGSNDGMMRRDDLILSEGQAHVVSMGIPAHVPFQDLIDNAIDIMSRVPPRKLLGLASRYFDEPNLQPMTELYPSITYFQEVPSWALAGTAKADWVLKQRARDRQALTELRNRKWATDMVEADTTISTPDVVARKAKKLNWPKAMIAQGFGPGEAVIARQNTRRKLLMFGGAATVAIFAIALGLAMQNPRSSNQSWPNTTPSDIDFDIEREEAVSYVKSTKTPRGPKRRQSRSSPTQCLDSDRPSSALLHVDRDLDRTNESLVQAYFQKYVMRELQLLYAKLRVMMGTFAALSETIQDPNFTGNVQAALHSATQTVASVQDPKVRAAIHKTVAKRATQATQFVGGVASNVFKWTASHARAHLGGNNFEQLGLL